MGGPRDPRDPIEAALRQQIATGLSGHGPAAPSSTPDEMQTRVLSSQRILVAPPMPPMVTPPMGTAPTPPDPRMGSPMMPPPLPSSPLLAQDAWVPESRSGQRPVEREAGASREKMPLGYVVASVFFLVIAAVGFGLWLALAVISL